MLIDDLKEMDIVKQRDGRLLYVFKNSFTGRLQTFSYNLWGQRELTNYYSNFKYGKLVKFFNEEVDNKNDIVEVFQINSVWKSINIMRIYERSLKEEDQKEKESLYNEIFKKYQFIKVLD